MTLNDNLFYAGDLFTTVDTMQELIVPQCGGTPPVDVCSKTFIIEQYFGKPRVESVVELFRPRHLCSSPPSNKDGGSTNVNQALYDLIDEN